MITDSELADVIAELESENERLKEALSYLPKVPTQPYEKELAKENERLRAENNALQDIINQRDDALEDIETKGEK